LNNFKLSEAEENGKEAFLETSTRREFNLDAMDVDDTEEVMDSIRRETSTK